MKLIIAVVFVCVAHMSCQQKLSSSNVAQILRYETQNDGSGNYKFAYETTDGQSREEEGKLKNAGTEDEAMNVSGSFSFVGQDGVRYTVKYIADENGFRPVGDHLPRINPYAGAGIRPATLRSIVVAGLR